MWPQHAVWVLIPSSVMSSIPSCEVDLHFWYFCLPPFGTLGGRLFSKCRSTQWYNCVLQSGQGLASLLDTGFVLLISWFCRAWLGCGTDGADLTFPTDEILAGWLLHQAIPVVSTGGAVIQRLSWTDNYFEVGLDCPPRKPCAVFASVLKNHSNNHNLTASCEPSLTDYFQLVLMDMTRIAACTVQWS